MAKLQSGTRIYGTANVDTSVTVGTSTITTGTGALLANVTTLFIGNNSVNTYLNTTGLNVNSATIANVSGFYTTGTVNAVSYTIGSSYTANSTTIALGSTFIANSSQLTVTTPTSANGSVGTAGQILASNGSSGSPYWRNTVRTNSITSTSSIALDASLYDMYSISALATSLTFTASTTGATDGRKMMIKIKDNGGAQGLTFICSSGAGGQSAGYFRPIGLTLPGTTTIGKTIYIGCIYNADATTASNPNVAAWDVIAYTIEA